MPGSGTYKLTWGLYTSYCKGNTFSKCLEIVVVFCEQVRNEIVLRLTSTSLYRRSDIEPIKMQHAQLYFNHLERIPLNLVPFASLKFIVPWGHVWQTLNKCIDSILHTWPTTLGETNYLVHNTAN